MSNLIDLHDKKFNRDQLGAIYDLGRRHTDYHRETLSGPFDPMIETNLMHLWNIRMQECETKRNTEGMKLIAKEMAERADRNAKVFSDLEYFNKRRALHVKRARYWMALMIASVIMLGIQIYLGAW